MAHLAHAAHRTHFLFSSHTPTQRIALSIAYGILTVAGTFLRLPLPWTIVPVTMQPFMALLAGAILGPTYGLISQVIYILGLPFSFYYAQGYGLLLTPLAGYVVGTAACALWAGLLIGVAPRLATRPFLLAPALMGIIALSGYGIGAGVLYLMTGFSTGIWLTLPQLLIKGVIPFLFGDALKAIAAARLISWYHRFSASHS